ncbi:MAG TPA: CBS domain-containing protein [Xanthobacteraceae bacterium]|jgi:CBS domain-containing protein
MTVKAILSTKGYSVVTIRPGTTLADAAQVLAKHRIGAVIVAAADGRLAGMLSERDIVRALAERGAAALELKVDDVMTRKVVTCTEADTVGALMEQMTNGKFRHVPVLDGERLTGVISIGDVVKYRLGEVEAESNAMRDYILTA